MCGIIGYVGERPAAELIINGLKRLEYRGYDSSGIALVNGKQQLICTEKNRENRGTRIYTRYNKTKKILHRDRTYQVGNPRSTVGHKCSSSYRL